MSVLIAFALGLVLGVVFHGPLKRAAAYAWHKFRAWRRHRTSHH